MRATSFVVLACVAALLVAGCEKAPANSVPKTASVAQENEEKPAVQDWSEVPNLPQQAEKMQRIAAMLEADVRASCRKDDAEMWRVQREAGAELDAWRSMKASDLHRSAFQGCESSLVNVSGMAANCVSNLYSTAMAEQKDRFLAEDKAFCVEDLKKPWPPKSIDELR